MTQLKCSCCCFFRFSPYLSSAALELLAVLCQRRWLFEARSWPAGYGGQPKQLTGRPPDDGTGRSTLEDALT